MSAKDDAFFFASSQAEGANWSNDPTGALTAEDFERAAKLMWEAPDVALSESPRRLVHPAVYREYRTGKYDEAILHTTGWLVRNEDAAAFRKHYGIWRFGGIDGRATEQERDAALEAMGALVCVPPEWERERDDGCGGEEHI